MWSQTTAPVTEPTGPITVNPVQLGRLITRYFNLEELRLLCFELGCEFEELGEGARTTTSINLAKASERSDRLDQLAQAVLRVRPGRP